MQPRRTHPLRILSVNDEEAPLKVVEIIIARYFKGVTVQSFRDAEEAWQELSRADPDLLITDDIMGKLNGDEIVQRLADRKVAYPIIVINAYGPERDQWVSDFAKRGVNVAMLRAPFDSEGLARAVESGLRIPRDTTGPAETTTKPPKTRPPRIVVLDDESLVCDHLKLVLHLGLPNAEILTFTDAEQALQELTRNDPDLFTTDIVHPGFPCEEMLWLLAARHVKYPIFVISAWAASGKGKELARQFGDQGLNVTLLEKPFTVEQFHALLLKHLSPGDGLERKG